MNTEEQAQRELVLFLDLVSRLRDVQKSYAKYRMHNDHLMVKALERQVDEFIRTYSAAPVDFEVQERLL